MRAFRVLAAFVFSASDMMTWAANCKEEGEDVCGAATREDGGKKLSVPPTMLQMKVGTSRHAAEAGIETKVEVKTVNNQSWWQECCDLPVALQGEGCLCFNTDDSVCVYSEMLPNGDIEKDTGSGMLIISDMTYPKTGVVQEVHLLAHQRDTDFYLSAWYPATDGTAYKYERRGAIKFQIPLGDDSRNPWFQTIDVSASGLTVEEGDFIGWYSASVQPVYFNYIHTAQAASTIPSPYMPTQSAPDYFTVRRTYDLDEDSTEADMTHHANGWKRNYWLKACVGPGR